MPDETDKPQAELERPVDPVQAALFDEMTKAGLLYGRRKSKTNPKMKRRFVLMTRSGIEVFDLTKTVAALDEALAFLSETIKNRGTVLFVGTEPAAKDLVKKTAEALGAPYVIERWLGGTLTNFETIYRRIEYYRTLKADKAAGRLDKYTKKERVLIDRKIDKLTKFFSGVEGLTRLPDALFVADAGKHPTAVREAKKVRLPVVAVVNSDTDPDLVRYPIPANGSSVASLAWVLGRLETALRTAKEQVASLPPAENKTQPAAKK